MATVAVKERPIPFSGEMVRAILDGRKTVTRRVVKPQPELLHEEHRLWKWRYGNCDITGNEWLLKHWHGERHIFETASPYGEPGDRLWIKSSYWTRYEAGHDQTFWTVYGAGFIVTHGRALSKSGKPKRDGKHAGMFMPNWLSQELRLPVLEITDVRVERVQDITEADAIAEGFKAGDGSPVNGFDTESPFPARAAFAGLWDTLNGPRGYGWEVNPWAWVVAFKVVE